MQNPNEDSVINPEWEKATTGIWFIGLEPMPAELGGDGVTKPYDPINIGPPPNETPLPLP